MLIDEDRTWERKRQLEMETAIEDAVKETTKKVTQRVKKEITQRVKKEVAQRITREVSLKQTCNFIKALLSKGKMNDEDIADVTEVTVDFVKKIKQGLTLA